MKTKPKIKINCYIFLLPYNIYVYIFALLLVLKSLEIQELLSHKLSNMSIRSLFVCFLPQQTPYPAFIHPGIGNDIEVV